MKRIFLLSLCLLLTTSTANADDGMWDSYSQNIDTYGEQKFVGDDEFNEAIEKINSKNKVKKWMNILQGTTPQKGSQYSKGNETEEINNTQGEKADLPVLSLPVEISFREGIIPVGHYQVKGETENNKYILNLYQAHELIAKIPAYPTDEDFEKEEILFADWININDEQIKLIYGSLDFNAYAILNINN